MPILYVLLFTGLTAAAESVLFREEFEDLDGWEPYVFRGIERHTDYRIVVDGNTSVLQATSDAGASALIGRQRFSVAEYPIITWRWKVDNLYEQGNYRSKAGDDYPLRVYVIFAYDPQMADFGTRIKYELARALHGQYPPHSSINYIWANRADEQETVPNPFTDRAMMIPLRSGPQHVGTWQEEEVDVYRDYLQAFGEPPPAVATLAVMNDADNTGEAATSYIDFIEVRRR